MCTYSGVVEFKVSCLVEGFKGLFRARVTAVRCLRRTPWAFFFFCSRPKPPVISMLYWALLGAVAGADPGKWGHVCEDPPLGDAPPIPKP